MSLTKFAVGVRAANSQQLGAVLLHELYIIRATDHHQQNLTGEPSDGALLHVLLAVLGRVFGEGDDGVPHGDHRHHSVPTPGGESHPVQVLDHGENGLGLHVEPVDGHGDVVADNV